MKAKIFLCTIVTGLCLINFHTHAQQFGVSSEVCDDKQNTLSDDEYNACVRNGLNLGSIPKDVACKMKDGSYTGSLQFKRVFNNSKKYEQVGNIYGFVKNDNNLFYDVTELSVNSGNIKEITVFNYSCKTKKASTLALKDGYTWYNKDIAYTLPCGFMCINNQFPYGTWKIDAKNKEILIGTIGGFSGPQFENHKIRVYNFKEKTITTQTIVPPVKFISEEPCKDICPKIEALNEAQLSGWQYMYMYYVRKYWNIYSDNGIQLYNTLQDGNIARKVQTYIPGVFNILKLYENGTAIMGYYDPGMINQTPNLKKFTLDIKKKSYIREQAEHGPDGLGKPVIYLYPPKEQKTKVIVDIKDGIIDISYPQYPKNGREVTAYPDGKIINNDKKEYSYLFWEGIGNLTIDKKEGYIIAGEHAREFLQEILPTMGLTPKEYNEFIVYWYPLMKKNKLNYVKFLQQEYQDEVSMNISPKPDSILRVFMYFEGTEKPFTVKKQNFQPFERKGFTVVEWGGSEGNKK